MNFLAYPSTSKNKNEYIYLAYIDGLLVEIARFFSEKYNFSVIFKTLDILGNLIKNHKDKIDIRFIINDEGSAYFDHLEKCGSNFDYNFDVLHSENENVRSKLVGSLEIIRYNSKQILPNDQTEVNSSLLLNIFI